MSASTTVDTEISDEETAVDWWAVARLVLAWLATGCGLPLGIGICLMYWLEYRYPPTLLMSWFFPTAFVVLLLTWRLGWNETIRPWNRLILVGVLLTWFISTASYGYVLTSSPHQHGWIIAFYAASTLWMPWLAWFGFWPASFFSRFCVLVVLIAALFGFHSFVKVEGLSGSAIVNLEWRKHTSRSLATTLDDQPTVEINLKPTPYDFPQFLGPMRDARVRSVDLNPDWVNHPPEMKWRQPIGLGWSAMAIVGDVAFTQEQRENDECVVCYELRTGKTLWIHTDLTEFRSSYGGNGPRATPTVDEGKVYTVGATGIVQCLDGQTGKTIWAANLLPEGAKNLDHGVCGSPLVVDDLLYVCPVSSDDECLRAYDKKTGKVVFNAGGGRAAYSSPTLFEIGGTPQVLAFNSKSLVSYDAKTGAILWSHPWENKTNTNVSQPLLYRDDKENVFLSTGYDKGSTLLSVSHGDKNDWKVEERWTSRKMKNKFTSSVIIDDFVVGLDDGILAGLDLKSGKPLWKLGRYGHGQILLIGKHLVVLTETGDLVLVEPTAKGTKELGKVPEAIVGKTWTNLAFSPPYLLIRNSQEAACYKLAIAGEPESKSTEPAPMVPAPVKIDTASHEPEKKTKPAVPAVAAPVKEDPVPFPEDQPKFPEDEPVKKEEKPAAIAPPAPPIAPAIETPKPVDTPKPGEEPKPVEVPSLDLPPIGLPPVEKP